MKVKRNELIAYAQSFASFILAGEIGDKINNIILFGSVAAGEFDEESDIDIFIDIKGERERVKKELILFEQSQISRIWREKGIERNISLTTGELDKTPSSLKRSILSSGIQLYGKFKQLPSGMEYYTLFILNFNRLSRKNKVSVWRKLYGYKQKINKKLYSSKGIVAEVRGKKLERGTILVPADASLKFRNFLKKHRIDYKIYEIWSDSF